MAVGTQRPVTVTLYDHEVWKLIRLLSDDNQDLLPQSRNGNAAAKAEIAENRRILEQLSDAQAEATGPRV